VTQAVARTLLRTLAPQNADQAFPADRVRGCHAEDCQQRMSPAGSDHHFALGGVAKTEAAEQCEVCAFHSKAHASVLVGEALGAVSHKILARPMTRLSGPGAQAEEQAST
jgi:hypothetical protein